MGKPEDIDFEAIRETAEFYGYDINLAFTEGYVNEIRADDRYLEILLTERQFLEYFGNKMGMIEKSFFHQVWIRLDST